MSTLVPGLGLISFGIGEAVFLFAILMLLFGAKKLPDLARGLGLGIRNFKGEMKQPDDEPAGELEEEVEPRV